MAPQHPSGALSFAALIADEDAYHRELDKLAMRASGRRIETLTHEGVRFSQMLDDAERLVPLLARAVADGTYRPGPATLGLARIGKRERAIGRVSGLDLVVHGVVARAIAAVIASRLSDRLYSYQRGRSPWQAVRWLAKLTRPQRSLAEPTARGLYVLRSDIEDYTDSIDASVDGTLFRELTEALAATSNHVSMLARLLRPAVDGTPRSRGLLFGLPTTNVLGNLYLTPIDRALEGLGSYARYGDDVLFAHADYEVVQRAKELLHDGVRARGLRLSAQKLQVFYWNGAPRPSMAWPEAVPSRDIHFLGASVRWNGTVCLAPKKWRSMLRDLHRRIRRACALSVDPDDETSRWPKRRARAAVAVVEAAFDPTSPLALGYVPLLRDLVDDRKQLEELDYLIAKWIAEAATGITGPRAFRDVPWKWLRNEAGLRSRLQLRNRGE